MTGDVRITRRRLLQTASVGGLALLVPSAALARTARSAKLAENVVLRWNDALLQGVRDSKLGPPMVSRALAIIHTCAYDAWAAYDRDAAGTRFGGELRVPPNQRTRANKEEAISFAAYRAAVDLFPGSRTTVFDPLMAQLGFDPNDSSIDASSMNRIRAEVLRASATNASATASLNAFGAAAMTSSSTCPIVNARVVASTPTLASPLPRYAPIS